MFRAPLPLSLGSDPASSAPGDTAGLGTGHRPLVLLLHDQPTLQMFQQQSQTNTQKLQLSPFLLVPRYGLILETSLSIAAKSPGG